MKYSLCVLLTITALPTFESPQWIQRYQNFRLCLESTGVCPIWNGESGFENTLEVYNLMYNWTVPLVYVEPHNLTEVQQAVVCASKYHIPITPRSGGHSYGGFGRGEDGAMIMSLTYINQIKIHPDGTQAMLGVGNRMGRIFYELWTLYRRFPIVGSGSTIGLGGFVMGGGQGVFSRNHGYMSDNVLELEVVLADGQIVYPSRNNYTDLFWAMRGAGGGNLGIITRVRAKVHRSPVPMIASQVLQGSISDARATLKAFDHFQKIADRRVGAYLAFSAGNGFAGSLVCLCSPAKMIELLEPLYELLPPTVDTSIKVAGDPLVIWQGISSSFFPINSTAQLNFQPNMVIPTNYIYLKSLFTATGEYLTDEALDALEYALDNSPFDRDEIMDTSVDNVALINVEFVGGAMNEPRPDSAMIARNESLLLEFYVSRSEYLTRTHMAWVQDLYDVMYPCTATHSYVNFQDLFIKNPGKNYYGHNLARLKCINKFYDPHSLFTFPLNLAKL